jgi:hypothetical protein
MDKKWWEITFVTDYPFSDKMLVLASTEDDAWDKFAKKGRERNEYCLIKMVK